MRVELLYFAGCPNVERARTVLRRCLALSGLPAEVDEIEGDHPSPTIRIDGHDVMGEPATSGRACRLDVPTEERLLAALRGAR